MTGVPLTVVALLDSPVIGLDQPTMLDGPLAWAYAQWAHTTVPPTMLPPLTAGFAADLPLPLARHDVAGTWVWCTSRAKLVTAGHTSVEVRRKPNIAAMARFGRERKFHLGLGPHKARDTTIAASWVTEASWEVVCTDRPFLEVLLGMVTHLGARHRNGHGHVREWRVGPSDLPEGWRDRPMPTSDPGGIPYGVRAPYWHPTRHYPCAGVALC